VAFEGFDPIAFSHAFYFSRDAKRVMNPKGDEEKAAMTDALLRA